MKKYNLLLLSIIIVIIIIGFVVKNVLLKKNIENFDSYSIFYPNKDEKLSRAMMYNINNYEILNKDTQEEYKLYEFNGESSYIYIELLKELETIDILELNEKIIIEDFINNQTLVSGLNWDITLKDNKINFNIKDDASIELLTLLEDIKQIEMKLKYNTKEKNIEIELGDQKVLIEKEINLSSIFIGKKFIDTNTSENYFKGLIGGIIINSINLEETTTQTTMDTTTQTTMDTTTQTRELSDNNLIFKNLINTLMDITNEK